MHRRLIRIGLLASVGQVRTRRGVIAVLLIVLIIVPAFVKADDRKGSLPTAGKTGGAVNVMWRFDGGGRFPNIHPPSEWRMDRNILWKTPVEVGGYSSPIVVGDRVFVTAEMGNLICLDLADGKILWKKDLFSQDSEDIPADLSKKLMRGCGGDSKQSTPTPTSNGELVFYINAMGLCACYDLQGHQKWIRIIETAEDEEHFSSSPIFLGDSITLSWGCLLALNATDGSTKWKAAAAKPTHGTPAIAKIGGIDIAITPGGDIVKLADGEILCSGLFESTFTTPLIEGNMLYVIDAKSRALELPAKAEQGMKLVERWRSRLKGKFMASPIYRDGLIYTIESQKSRLVLLDAKTGEVLSATREVDEATKAESIEPGQKIEGLTRAQFAYASPVATEDNLYCFDDAGNTAVLELPPRRADFQSVPQGGRLGNPSSSRPIELGREHKLTRINKLDGGFVGTPFFINDKIIIRGSETVYCIGDKN